MDSISKRGSRDAVLTWTGSSKRKRSLSQSVPTWPLRRLCSSPLKDSRSTSTEPFESHLPQKTSTSSRSSLQRRYQSSSCSKTAWFEEEPSPNICIHQLTQNHCGHRYGPQVEALLRVPQAKGEHVARRKADQDVFLRSLRQDHSAGEALRDERQDLLPFVLQRSQPVLRKHIPERPEEGHRQDRKEVAVG